MDAFYNPDYTTGRSGRSLPGGCGGTEDCPVYQRGECELGQCWQEDFEACIAYIEALKNK
jgi:hypothetical protein